MISNIEAKIFNRGPFIGDLYIEIDFANVKTIPVKLFSGIVSYYENEIKREELESIFSNIEYENILLKNPIDNKIILHVLENSNNHIILFDSKFSIDNYNEISSVVDTVILEIDHINSINDSFFDYLQNIKNKDIYIIWKVENNIYLNDILEKLDAISNINEEIKLIFQPKNLIKEDLMALSIYGNEKLETKIIPLNNKE